MQRLLAACTPYIYIEYMVKICEDDYTSVMQQASLRTGGYTLHAAHDPQNGTPSHVIDLRWSFAPHPRVTFDTLFSGFTMTRFAFLRQIHGAIVHLRWTRG